MLEQSLFKKDGLYTKNRSVSKSDQGGWLPFIKKLILTFK
jgi:hypothetical protein